jgi:hypothetical protein
MQTLLHRPAQVLVDEEQKLFVDNSLSSTKSQVFFSLCPNDGHTALSIHQQQMAAVQELESTGQQIVVM